MLPVGLGPLLGRRPSSSPVLGHLSPHLNHRLIVSTPPIRNQWWWRTPMPSPLLELLERFDGSLRLVLGQATCCSQSGIALDQRTAPEPSGSRTLFVAPFCPLF